MVVELKLLKLLTEPNVTLVLSLRLFVRASVLSRKVVGSRPDPMSMAGVNFEEHLLSVDTLWMDGTTESALTTTVNEWPIDIQLRGYAR